MKNYSGWGLTLFGLSEVKHFDLAKSTLSQTNERGCLARGNGRSYGDSSLNSGGVILERSTQKFVTIDKRLGHARISGGALIDELEVAALLCGFFPPVVPGTAKVTIGGAIASDVHGKSHHISGSFSNHLLEITLLTSNAEILKLRPQGVNSRLFWATVGGMGLTGIILEAKIKLTKVATSYVRVRSLRTANLKDTLIRLHEFDKLYEYTVAWLDLSGQKNGRSIVTGACHANVNELPIKFKSNPVTPLTQNPIKIPKFQGFSLINSFSTRIFNFFWYHKPLQNNVQHVQKFLHPLDRVENWNTLYGTKGFIQYQFVIPFESSEFLEVVINELKRARLFSPMAVLKSLGEESKGLLGFSKEGWTLAVDFALGNPRLNSTLNTLDELLIEVGGRIYLTKDSRMNSCHMSQMYPKLEQWKSIKSENDPNNVWQSDQGRRLNLC